MGSKICLFRTCKVASSDSGEPRESGGSLASRPGFFFFRARQGHPLPALHAVNSYAGTDLPVFTQKDITRRWAPSTQSRSLGQAPNVSFPATAPSRWPPENRAGSPPQERIVLRDVSSSQPPSPGFGGKSSRSGLPHSVGGRMKMRRTRLKYQRPRRGKTWQRFSKLLPSSRS